MARRIHAKLVLELLGKGMTGREIYRTRRMAQQSVKKVREAARKKGVTWEDVRLMGEREVYDLLFPEQAQLEAATAQADYDYVHSELQRDGVTLLILWEEYRDQAIANELVPKSSMVRWMNYIDCRCANHHPEGYENWGAERKERDRWLWSTDFHYGDWLIPSIVLGNPDGAAMLDTAYATMSFESPYGRIEIAWELGEATSSGTRP